MELGEGVVDVNFTDRTGKIPSEFCPYVVTISAVSRSLITGGKCLLSPLEMEMEK